MNDCYRMPEQGMSRAEVVSRVRDLRSGMTEDQSGKLAATTFQGHADMQQVTHDAFVEFMDWNGLFTFREPAAARLENDVLDMCMGFMNGGPGARANLTTGGTESNFCALHAMRGWARKNRAGITKPEIVAPYSTHATIHKTARYLDLEVVTVPQLPDLSADVDAIRAAVSPNTIGIVASAPNWPYGRIDPVEELGYIARQQDLWLHVDACVGGYILPFFRELGEAVPLYDFRVPAVRSISADLHKYAYAPKPLSSIHWRSLEEQSFHYMPVTEWPCGMYLSQSFAGSRTLGSVAGIWALMHYWGKSGYRENARRILEIKRAIVDQCDAIEGIHAWNTDGPLLMIASDEFDIRLLAGAMEQRQWYFLGVQDPPAIHLTLDVLTDASLQKLLRDLEETTADIRTGRLTEEGMLTYAGVGARETAPKWLLSALEIMEQQST